MTYMFYGSFTPGYFSELRKDPEIAQRDIEIVLAATDMKLLHIFFSTGEHQFFCFVEGESIVRFHSARLLLMARGAFAHVFGEVLLDPRHVLPFMQSVRGKALAAGPAAGR